MIGGPTIVNSYDGVGNRPSRTGFNATGRGETISEVYAYNANNQLTSMSSPCTGTTSYDYDEAGNLTKATRGALVCDYEFDYLNRMTSYDRPDGGFPSPFAGNDGNSDGGDDVDDEEDVADGYGYDVVQGDDVEEDETEEGEANAVQADGNPPTIPPSIHVDYTFCPHHWAQHTKPVDKGAGT